MRNKAKTFLFFICGLFLSSCASWQAVKAAPGLNATSEIIMKPELEKLVSYKRPNIKIVLRVPGAPKEITQEAQKDVARPYDSLERELSKAGFIVRDRELLEKVVSEAKPAGYPELARTMDTDLILEVLYIGPCDLSHKTYYSPQAGRLLELSNPSMELKHPGSLPFLMHGGMIDCRVISVLDGTVSGMFTLYNLPCGGLCDFEVLDNKEWRNPEPNPNAIKGWGVGADDQNVRDLAALFVQTLTGGEIAVATVAPNKPAWKSGFRPNDIIEKINNQPVYNLSQALDMLIRSEGKTEIMLKRESAEVPVSLTKKFGEQIGIQLTYKPKPPLPPPPPPVVEVKPVAPPPAPVVTPPAPPAAPTVTPVKTKKAKKKITKPPEPYEQQLKVPAQ